jgi:hypothetical protein
MTHALAFTSSLFKKFIDSNGVVYKNPTQNFVGPTG